MGLVFEEKSLLNLRKQISLLKKYHDHGLQAWSTHGSIAVSAISIFKLKDDI